MRRNQGCTERFTLVSETSVFPQETTDYRSLSRFPVQRWHVGRPCRRLSACVSARGWAVQARFGSSSPRRVQRQLRRGSRRHPHHRRPPGGQRHDRAAGAAGRRPGQVHPYRKRGQPALRPLLVNDDAYTIVSTYGAECRGLVNYYLLAGDMWRLGRVRWVMETSMLKTLPANTNRR